MLPFKDLQSQELKVVRSKGNCTLRANCEGKNNTYIAEFKETINLFSEKYNWRRSTMLVWKKLLIFLGNKGLLVLDYFTNKSVHDAVVSILCKYVLSYFPLLNMIGKSRQSIVLTH
jgi:hypothetical protein